MRRWIADFTYLWTREGWLYVAVVIDLYSLRRRLVDERFDDEPACERCTDDGIVATRARF
jgi:putative transposase